MPLELTRKAPEELCPDAVIYSETPPKENVRRGFFVRRLDIPLPEGDDLCGRYLNGLEEARLHRRGRIAMALPKNADVPHVRAALRAASIFLRSYDASVYLSVRSGLTPEGPAYGSLRDYIAERYTGVEPGGGIFERRFYRSAPDMAPTAPPDGSGFFVGVAPEERDDAVVYSAPSVRPTVLAMSEKAKAARILSDAGLQDMLDKLDAGFSQTLMALIDKSGRTDPEIYKRANVDRKLFSKIRSNPAYRPSKTTALAFAVALELDMDGVRDLLSRAGYSLTHASRGDIIVEYFITRGNYDIFEINETLFAFDQPLLGGAS